MIVDECVIKDRSELSQAAMGMANKLKERKGKRRKERGREGKRGSTDE